MMTKEEEEKVKTFTKKPRKPRFHILTPLFVVKDDQPDEKDCPFTIFAVRCAKMLHNDLFQTVSLYVTSPALQARLQVIPTMTNVLVSSTSSNIEFAMHNQGVNAEDFILHTYGDQCKDLVAEFPQAIHIEMMNVKGDTVFTPFVCTPVKKRQELLRPIMKSQRWPCVLPPIFDADEFPLVQSYRNPSAFLTVGTGISLDIFLWMAPRASPRVEFWIIGAWDSFTDKGSFATPQDLMKKYPNIRLFGKVDLSSARYKNLLSTCGALLQPQLPSSPDHEFPEACVVQANLCGTAVLLGHHGFGNLTVEHHPFSFAGGFCLNKQSFANLVEKPGNKQHMAPKQCRKLGMLYTSKNLALHYMNFFNQCVADFRKISG